MSTHSSGAAWEQLAERYLAERGAKLLARNYRRGRGEVDLIVRMDDVTVFVEVKQRGSEQKGSPGEAVTAAKQRRICEAALYYLKENHLMDSRVRFDVVEILQGRIRHLPGAFPYRPPRG